MAVVDFKADLDAIKYAQKLAPGNVTDTLLTEDEASSFVEEWANANLSRLFSADEGSYSHSIESVFDALNKKLLKRARSIIEAKDRGERAEKAIADVETVASVLRDFIREFCRNYILLAPTPDDPKKYPYSYGNYIRSSIMYFTNDEDSRRRALIRADSSSNRDEFIYGQQYIIDQLTPYQLFYRKGDTEKKIRRILGGISIENIAFKDTSGTPYYYGWKNVERLGWKTKNGRKAPYSPFQHALAKTKKSFHIGNSTSFVDTVLHDEEGM